MTINELKEWQPKLESLTQKTRGCHYYTGTKQKGRGVIRVGKKMKNAATMTWELNHGENLPELMVVKQSCENRLCINPKHLYLSRKTYGWRI